MRKFTVLILLLHSVAANSQLLENKELLKGINSVTTRSFNGSGGGGYWTFEKLNKQGQTISKDYYRNKELLAKDVYRYNEQNDQTLWVQTYDINNPSRIDSVITEYEYNKNGIISRQKQTFSNSEDSIIYELINLSGDTLNYSRKEYYYRPKTEKIETFSYQIYVVFNTENQVLFKKVVDNQEITIEVTEYEYNSKGQLSRRTITRIPEPEHEIVYMGGPGSDDLSYKYTYFKSGLIKKVYYVIGGKRIKITEYSYEKS